MAFKDRPFFRRMLDFHDLMRRGKRVNATTLARTWETSTKTIQRFVEQMRNEFDAPIVWDAVAATYRYSDPGYRLPWLPIDGKDLFAIAVASRVLQIYDGTPAARDLKEILRRLEEFMPPNLRVSPTSLVEQLYVLPLPFRVVRPDVWDEVVTALREKLALEARYRKPSGDESTRTLEPYALSLAGGNWLLVARDTDDGQTKSFYLSRIVAATVTKQRFAIPRDFRPERYFEGSLGVYAGKQKLRFRVRFEKSIAAWVAEVTWQPKQRVTTLDDGAIELELSSASLWEARRFVLSFGRLALAVSPPELVQDVKRELGETKALYE